jgi:alcohol dehydrogenase
VRKLDLAAPEAAARRRCSSSARALSARSEHGGHGDGGEYGVKAWRLERPGGRLELIELETPIPRAGGVVVRMEAAPVLSYMRQVIDGTLGYAVPRGPFVPGTNGVGVVEAVGDGVYHLKPGDRVVLSPHHVVDERTAEPAQVLIGLTAMGLAETTLQLQSTWSDGVFAERAHLPAACSTPVASPLAATTLAAVGKFVVPYGGFLRGSLIGGETVIVNGASGYFGSAAVVLAIALGASRVIAAGRQRGALDEVVAAAGARALAVVLGGDVEADARALRDATGGGADLALDLVGRAQSAGATLATLRALRRGGRLVLMGSVAVPLPIAVAEMVGNDWSVAGCFMYPKDAPARLLRLVAAGALDLGKCRLRCFPLDALDKAIVAAASMRGLDFVALTMP